jgi:hypothetical protein
MKIHGKKNNFGQKKPMLETIIKRKVKKKSQSLVYLSFHFDFLMLWLTRI